MLQPSRAVCRLYHALLRQTKDSDLDHVTTISFFLTTYGALPNAYSKNNNYYWHYGFMPPNRILGGPHSANPQRFHVITKIKINKYKTI